MMSHFVLLIFISLLNNYSISTAKALTTEKIVGGAFASIGSLKYQVSIQANGLPICGGGIIHDMLIVTVAHCIIDQYILNFLQQHFSVAATIDALEPDEFILNVEVEKVYLPKNFDFMIYRQKSIYQADEDFAILKLKESLELDTNPLLRKLRTSETFHLDIRSIFVIAGYGAYDAMLVNSRVIETYDGKLRFAEVDIIGKDECGRLYNTTIHASYICAKVKQLPTKLRGTCRGDSGSPLVKNDEVFIGVLSLSPVLCIESVLPSVYVNISHHLSFIDNAMKGRIVSNMRVFSHVQIAPFSYSFVED